MKDEKQYQKTFLFGLIAGSLVFIFLAFLLGTYIGFDAGKKSPQAAQTSMQFYDAEGIAIPIETVQLLVRSQFNWIKPKEDSLLHKYFYAPECNHHVQP